MRWLSFAPLLALVAVAGCLPFARPTLEISGAAPPLPTPELRDVRNRLDVHYRLGGPARVSASIEAADGRQWVVHESVVRPTAGAYVLRLDGTVPGPGPNERRVLDNGDYRVVIVAQSDAGRQESTVPMVIRDADTTLPDVQDLTLEPDLITPDADAENDVTHVRFRLTKAARIAAFLDTVEPGGGVRRVWMGEEIEADPGERSVGWDGSANGQPVQSGTYMFGLRTRDLPGNVVEVSHPLTVERSGLPDATIVSARIGPRQLTHGSVVCLDAVVRNTGQTVLRSHGPEPGYVYNSLDQYSSIENHQFGEIAGRWRIGLSMAGNPSTVGATYSYRWGFGRDLSPGEEAQVRGCVAMNGEQTRPVMFAGLIRENVAIYNAGAAMVRLEVSP